jgi:hypothetical protein
MCWAIVKLIISASDGDTCGPKFKRPKYTPTMTGGFKSRQVIHTELATRMAKTRDCQPIMFRGEGDKR